MNKPIYDKLNSSYLDNVYPWHMPGHKRKIDVFKNNIYRVDITEIDGYDNLHHPEGIIKDSMEMATKMYNTKESIYLVNGSTCGNLASISSTCNINDKILMARNCHKSVYNAVRLLGLNPVYVYPEYRDEIQMLGGIDSDKIKSLLEENSDIKVVFLTSPTYEGVVLDITKIAKVIHSKNAILIVDEAHGAHFRYSDYFPRSAVEEGADIVIQSLHKTLPSMTQTAILHICSDRVDKERIKDYLSIYESSSPSYVMMASIDYCLGYLREDGQKLFKEYTNNLNYFRSEFNKLDKIQLIGLNNFAPCNVKDYDRGKLVFSTVGTNYTGEMLYEELLEEYKLQMEMSASSYVIAMTSIMDTKDDYLRLLDALCDINNKMTVNNVQTQELFDNKDVVTVLKPSVACGKKRNKVIFEESKEKICGEYIYVYPPGIPIIVPGEQISENIINTIKKYIELGLNIKGITDYKYISVIE